MGSGMDIDWRDRENRIRRILNKFPGKTREELIEHLNNLYRETTASEKQEVELRKKRWDLERDEEDLNLLLYIAYESEIEAAKKPAK